MPVYVSEELVIFYIHYRLESKTIFAVLLQQSLRSLDVNDNSSLPSAAIYRKQITGRVREILGEGWHVGRLYRFIYLLDVLIIVRWLPCEHLEPYAAETVNVRDSRESFPLDHLRC